MTRSQRFRAILPSIRKQVSQEMTSDSVVLCRNEECFLHDHLIGTYVRLPKVHMMPPEVDPEFFKIPGTIPLCTVRQCFTRENIV